MALLAVLLATLALARHASAQTPANQAPTTLTVMLTNGAVTLSWVAPAQDAASVTGYQVLRRRPDEGESAFQTLATDTMTTSTTYVDATADEDGVRHEYQVRALRGAMASAVSNSAELTLPFNLCDRTPEVEAALLAAVAATDCALVPGSQLAAVTALDLSAQSISSLQVDDFAGLTGLTTLDLEDNALTTLPAGVFNPLTSLTALDLRDNTGLSYSPYLLSVLTSLTTLDGSAYTRPTAPGAPTGLTGTFTAGKIELSWTAPGTGATTSYQILRKAGSDEEEVYVEDSYDPDADVPATTFTDSGVTEGETYEYRVRALNAGGVGVESGAATVLAALVISGPSGVSHPEESALRVATFTAGPARPSLTWSLTGDDSADFSIEGGVLRFAPAPTPMADYESPADDGQDNQYSVTVQAAEQGATSVTMNVTVTVTDVDEAGTLTLSSTRPGLGAALTATLNDPDDVEGTPVYTWERSLSPNSWAVISGATSSTYTPVAADAGRFLRAAVTYEDGHGAGQTASTVAYEVVTASLLTALQVTTTDSTANPARALMPAFSADVLHYAVGCTEAGDTMTVTPTAASGVRLAVDGVQIASGTGRAVAVARESDVHIALTGADGAITTYVVHCLINRERMLEATKTPGATGILEELIMLRFYDSVAIVDNNGVPRFRRAPGHPVWNYFRVDRVAGTDRQQGHDLEYRCSYVHDMPGAHAFTVLDQSLEILDTAITTVAPLVTTDLHDFRVLENGDYLLLAYEPAERDLSDLPFTHSGVEATQPQNVLDSAVQIVTPEGQALFSWNSWGNMPLEDCAQHRFPSGYAHINSLQMVDGLIIASFRGCSKVLAIDPDHAESHKVAWRVGRTNLTAAEWEARDIGPAPLAVVGDPVGEFCAQHAAQILPNGNLLLFDNGVHCVVNPWTGEFVGRTDEDYYSRGVEYALDHANGEAVFVRDHSLRGARQYVGNSQGHVDPLANGDWLISWGRARRSVAPDDPEVPIEAVTQVDPDTGEEKFSLRDPDNPVFHPRAIPLHPVALFTDPGPLAAELPPSSATSVFTLGTTDAPQVVVAFSRPVVDFDADTPSVSVSGATVASVSPHLVAGEPGNAYVLTLTPDGDGAITFTLVANQTCAAGGVCAADGTMLTSIPAALVIGAPVTVEFGQATYTVAEGGTVQVAVTLSAAHQGVREVKVPLTVTDSAAMTHNYLVSAESVSFAAGERTRTVTVSARPDQDDNDDEYVTLRFGVLPGGVGAGATSETQVDINDDDDPFVDVRFGSSSYTVDEGDSVEVTLTLTANPERSVTIPLTVAREGGASSGDYRAPASVTFDSGETSKSISFAAIDDSDDDDDESLKLGFGMLPARVSAGSPDETTVSIADDDVPRISVTFVQRTYTVAEGTRENIRVTLSGEPERTVEIPLTVGEVGGATSSDYAGVPASVMFNSSETEQTIPFVASDDGEDDDGESVRLSLGALPERVTAGAITRTDIGITDDDLPPVSVSFEESDYEVAEGNRVVITLKLIPVPERTVSIPIVVTEFGADEDDYALSAHSVTFGSDQTTQTVTLTANDDREDDNGESVGLSLGDLPTRVTEGADPVTTVSIGDNDVTLSFGADAYHVNEGEDVTVQVWLNEAPGRRVTIPLTVLSQGGADSADYSGVPASITFEGSETVKSFTISATDDTDDDDDESLQLAFGRLPATVVADPPAVTTVSIGDDDDPEVAVRFEQSEYTAAEGSGVDVKVLLSADPKRLVTIPLTITDQGGATAGTDPNTGDYYPALPTSLTFQSGETEQEFRFDAVPDDAFDAGESVLIEIDSAALPERVEVTDPAETTVLISDDDLPQVTVSLDASSYSVTEGGRVTIGLSLSADPKRTVTIPITVTNQGGATDSDHSGVPPRVTFEAGETANALTLLATRDSDEDGGEWVVLGFDALPEGVSRGAIDAVTVTIKDGTRSTGGFVGGGGGGGRSGPSPSEVDFEWTVKRDIEALDSGHDSPTGSWSDGATLWVTENGDGADDAVYAYDLKTGERVEEREFELDEKNRAPRGVWSDGKVLWVSDSGQNKLFAHDLESGERLPDRDIALAARNRQARGIWSDEVTMWVLDGRHDALFAYDLESGELLAEYELDDANDDPYGIWGDEVTVWVSDHGAKRLFAYRLPVLSGEPDADGEDEGDKELERVRDEEFPNTVLSRASNNSPRGIWSDGDVMYVADASDGKVYSYNMPDAIDARLASLTLSGVDIGEFDPGREEYAGTPDEGVTETTVTAEAMQRRTDVDIDSPDTDEANGYQVALEGVEEITVTVTSRDGSRTKVYRVRFPEAAWDPARDPWPHCLSGAVSEGFSLVVYEGGSVEELVACAESREIVTLYALHEGVYRSFFLGGPDFVNREFTELFASGLPVMTPLVAGSNGPPSPDPFGDDLDAAGPQPWPECLRGDVVEGFSLAVYEGGSVEELEACAESQRVTALYALHGGEWVSYILGTPELANARFRELFPDGLPVLMPLVARSEGPAAAN